MNIRHSQLEVLEELWVLERRILLGILPPAYDKIDYELALTNTLTTVIRGRNVQEINNEYKKTVKRTKRSMLQDEIRRYETIIGNYDHKLQYELLMFERHFPDQNGDENPLAKSMNAFIIDRTEGRLREISVNMTRFRIRLARRLQRSSIAKNAIKVSPEAIIDTSDVPLNDAELEYLARGETQ